MSGRRGATVRVGERERGVTRNPNLLYLYSLWLTGLVWAGWASEILTKAGLISGPPQLIGLFLEASSFIITTSVNRFCKAVSYNRLG
jgi:hypothetical protein